jgi:riboflavin kinase/FMN adenylyltransferase
MQSLLTIKGTVKKGKERGKTLGFPTANIKVDKTIPEGIYASEVLMDGVLYKSTTFIGTVKTYNEKEFILESYILDFNEDIYGKEITVVLYKKIRNNKKFDSENLLIEQIKKDIEFTRNFFNLDH